MRILILSLSLFCAQAWAADGWYLSPGGFSYHERRENYNERNGGLIVEYRTGNWSAQIGQYRNSVNQYTSLALAGYWPDATRIALGASGAELGLGVVAGLIDGYRPRDGGWIPFAAPVLRLDVGRLAIHTFVAPPISKDEGWVLGVGFGFRVTP